MREGKWVASKGFEAVALLLLQHGADVSVNFRDNIGLAALDFAARRGNLAVADLLLQYGAVCRTKRL